MSRATNLQQFYGHHGQRRQTCGFLVLILVIQTNIKDIITIRKKQPPYCTCHGKTCPGTEKKLHDFTTHEMYFPSNRIMH